MNASIWKEGNVMILVSSQNSSAGKKTIARKFKKLFDILSNTLAFFLFLGQDFESCVKYHDPECRYIPGLKHDGFGDHRRQTMFFCGHRDDCT